MRKTRFFSKNFFLFVLTSDYWSETNLLLNLQCIYEPQRLCYISAYQKTNLSVLVLARVLKCFTHENGVALSSSPSLFFCPFPSANDGCFLQTKWADLHSFGLYSASNNATVNSEVGRPVQEVPCCCVCYHTVLLMKQVSVLTRKTEMQAMNRS